MCQYIFQKAGSPVWYFRRRIPAEAQHLYPKTTGRKPKAELVFSLKTKDAAEAAKRADAEARKLDRLWASSGTRQSDVADPAISLARLKAAGLSAGDGVTGVDDEGLSLPQVDDFRMSIIGEIEQGERRETLSAQDRLTLSILNGAAIPKTLEDARGLYKSLGKGPTEPKGLAQFDRAWNILFENIGNKCIANLRRADANEFVAYLNEKGLSSDTMRKYVAQISPVIKLAIREFELDCKNPFEGLELPNIDEGARHKRLPYSPSELKAVQRACREMDDPRRWLIAALSDTGARLRELQGMEQSDVYLGDPIPHIHIRPNSTRRLKTDESDRKVPLLGEALWAVSRAMEQPSKHLFPTLLPKVLGNEFDSGNASAALGKWLRDKKLASQGQALHSFRHTMADRLRNAGVLQHVMDSIGGWKTEGMSARYGVGFSLDTKLEAMRKALG